MKHLNLWNFGLYGYFYINFLILFAIAAGGVSKTVPSTGGDTSEGKTTQLKSYLLIFLIFMASYAFTFTTI